jgi:hypothetical protein
MILDYDEKQYHRALVCDVDDTLSLTTTRDWENAEPLWPAINRINELYDDGWYIILLTARGQLSCQRDTAKADEKYRDKMEHWLKEHGVKYHILSFNKYLASYYIDDKGLNPTEFIELDIKTIKTGWSGANVEKRGDRIYKTHPDSLNAAAWYKMASPLVNCPIVHNVIGETICLEFLNTNGKNFKIDDVHKDIEKFSLYKTYVPFSTYINRMKLHCEANNDFFEVLPLLLEYEDVYNANNSFCHGDFSIENIIQTNDGMFLIDPIYNPNNWSSYLLDVSKMMHSYRKYKRMFEYSVFMNYYLTKGIAGLKYRFNNVLNEKELYDWSKSILQLLEVTQWIRVVRYCPDKELKKQYIDLIHRMLIQLQTNKELSNDV